MMSERVRTALSGLRVQSAPTYRKLAEEMGIQPPPQPIGQYSQYNQGGPWQQPPPQQQHYSPYPQYPMAYQPYPQQYPNQQQQGAFPYYPPQLNYYNPPYSQGQSFTPQPQAQNPRLSPPSFQTMGNIPSNITSGPSPNPNHQDFPKLKSSTNGPQ